MRLIQPLLQPPQAQGIFFDPSGAWHKVFCGCLYPLVKPIVRVSVGVPGNSTRSQSAKRCSSVVPRLRQKMQRRGVMTKKATEEFDEKEAQARFEAALRAGLKTAPKPLKDKPKVKKTKAKKKKAK